MGRPSDRGKPRQHVFTMRFTDQERADLVDQRSQRGFQSDAAYVRRLLNEDARRLAQKRAES